MKYEMFEKRKKKLLLKWQGKKRNEQKVEAEQSENETEKQAQRLPIFTRNIAHQIRLRKFSWHNWFFNIGISNSIYSHAS